MVLLIIRMWWESELGLGIADYRLQILWKLFNLNLNL